MMDYVKNLIFCVRKEKLIQYFFAGVFGIATSVLIDCYREEPILIEETTTTESEDISNEE